jgi:acetylxylan esterase
MVQCTSHLLRSTESVVYRSSTSDTILYPQNFFEEIKQWTSVFGYSSTPISNVSESYLPKGYSNSTYGPRFQAILAQNVGHTVPLYEQQYLQFFGLA